MASPKLDRLQGQLLTSGLQNKDQPLYQVISTIISETKQIEDNLLIITASIAGGKVDGPFNSTDNAIARWDGITGKLLANSGILIDDADVLQFGGITNSFPALKRSGLELQVRLADDSDYTTFRASQVTAPLLIGGSTAGVSFLEFRGSSAATSADPPFVWSANNTAVVIAKLFAGGTFAVAKGVTPTADTLGSGGTFFSARSALANGGFQAATELVANGTDVGYVDFGTFGTAASEKRVGAIHGFLTADATTNPTGDLVFYTTLAGTISEKMRISSTGDITIGVGDLIINNNGDIIWNGRARLNSPSNGHVTFSNNAASSGFVLQAGVTADTVIVANFADNAYGAVDALEYKLSASSGLTASQLTFTGRCRIKSPGNHLLTFESNSGATGFGLQTGTADVMLVANQANNAYGTVDCLGLKASGTAGFNGTVTPVNSITVVNGIVTAVS